MRLTVTLNQHLDYIMKSVGEKCNLYPPLIKYNSNFTLIHVHVSFLLYLCAKTAHKCILVLVFLGREISMAFGSNLMATLMTQAFFPCCLEFYFLGLNLTIFWPFAKLCFYTNKYVHCISLHEKIQFRRLCLI
jgi:hypothetical protein